MRKATIEQGPFMILNIEVGNQTRHTEEYTV